MNLTTHTLLAVLMLFVGSACNSLGSLNLIGRSSTSWDDVTVLTTAEAEQALASAEEMIGEGDYEQAVRHLKDLFYLRGLPIPQQTRASELIAFAAEREVKSLSQNEDLERRVSQTKDSRTKNVVEAAEALADFVDGELPSLVAVSAGIASARVYIVCGEAEEAWKILRRLDDLFPGHHESPTASKLLVESGLALSHDDRNWWFIWNAREEGMACLEYLVLNHPGEPRCDEAYIRLGEIYSEDNDRLLAIDRYSDLVLYHPESRLRAEAQAQIPMLRLDLLDSPEYDRKGLLLALAELDDWVARFPGHEMEEEVLLTRLDCLRRLSSSDLGIATFYDRIGNPEGRSYHAERALELANAAGDSSLATEAMEHINSSEPEDS